jgi:trk system potassium uptake protein TrkH
MPLPKKPYNPARYLIGGFMVLILLGSLLLFLPAATRSGGIAYIDALFTATSAVCLTGLVVVDTGTFFTPFGQAVIMLLIFTGTLGFTTMATLAFIFLGRRISLRDRLMVKEVLNQESMTGLIPLLKAIVFMIVLCELAGAALLSLRFVPQIGWAQGLFFALFHAVSAFGNAGFDLFGNFNSLTGFPADYLVNTVILVLFILGGLGFMVIFDLVKCFRRRYRLSLHSRLVLVISLILLLGGSAVILALEYTNPGTLGALPPGGKIFAALFSAATPRSGGFSMVKTASFGMPALLILMALMFIGGSPASGGGGIKTTTFGAVIIALVTLVRGRDEPVIFNRAIPFSQIFKAVAIIATMLTLLFLTALLLTVFENFTFQELMFEAVSAVCTVGLSLGITPGLSDPGKAVLIFAMFSGRLGPLTILLALSRRKPGQGELHYPEEKLLIG